MKSIERYNVFFIIVLWWFNILNFFLMPWIRIRIYKTPASGSGSETLHTAQCFLYAFSTRNCFQNLGYEVEADRKPLCSSTADSSPGWVTHIYYNTTQPHTAPKEINFPQYNMKWISNFFYNTVYYNTFFIIIFCIKVFF